MAFLISNKTEQTGFNASKSLPKGMFWMVIVLITFTSCASPYYWGATATNHGNRAQKQYIKNQRGHNPHRRFQNANQPTFGAQSVSGKGY
ncbi:MAG: hypothetical protein ABJH04_12115 [Cyclobacteriaceae bacterium]